MRLYVRVCYGEDLSLSDLVERDTLSSGLMMPLVGRTCRLVNVCCRTCCSGPSAPRKTILS